MKGLPKIRDPNPLPFKVCIFTGLMVIVSSPIIIVSNADYLHKIAACGVVLGVFGAVILYYETIATGSESETVVNEIVYTGSLTKLSLGEIAWVTAISLIMIPVLLLGIVGVLYHYKYGANESILHTVLRVILLVIGCALPAFGIYTMAKLTRVLCNRWLETIRVSQHDAQKEAVIKRILRLIGFASLLGAGILQFPATLF